MDSSDFSTLIGRLEREADAHPQLYLGKVAVAAALGYLIPGLIALAILACCFSILFALVTGGAPSFLAAVGILVGGAALIPTIRALRVQVPEPDGLLLTSDDAPDLFRLIDVISRKIIVVPFTTVKINGEFKLEIRQIPQWGVFGGYRNHVVIGAPLLLALSADEFCALLAHEVAHLGGNKRQFGAWVYRLRQSWNLLLPKLAQPANTFERTLASYHRWYAPWFSAYSFALARNHEYESDQLAAWVTSAQTLGRALIQVEMATRFLADVYWARFLGRVEEAPEPPYKPYSLLPRAFKILEKEPLRQQWLSEALRRYAAENDTHPSLTERLAALDVSPQLPPPATSSAALMTLGPAAQPAIDHCDDVWRTQNLANWRKRHNQIKEARWKIAEYEQQSSADLAPEDLWSKAQLLLSVHREEDAIDSLQQLVARKGSFPDAHLLLAQLLLKYGEEQGLEHLVAAVQQRGELEETAAAIGYQYLVNRGRKGEAVRFAQRIQTLFDE
ncbi:MAG TPA: M48 family metallopeptidase [Steroidobacteraceae bacterium]|nr:M48 family metallopeptidase [Steroidobacteraceae bacterium]